MGSFAHGVDQFFVRRLTTTKVIYEGARQKALASVKFGSELTGAPGQPVGPDEPEHEHLRDSIKLIDIAPLISRIEPTGEAVKWAWQNEWGIALLGSNVKHRRLGPAGTEYRLLSPVGGRFSFLKTRLGWPNIVEDVKEKLGS